MSPMKTIVLILTIYQMLLPDVKGDYMLQVRVNSYSNPDNHCPSCILDGNTEPGCCDEFQLETCTGGARCDNRFFYCLRPLGTTSTDRMCSGRSGSPNINGEPIDFSDDVVLALENPLLLNGLTNEYRGVQLYVDVNDDDGLPSLSKLVGAYFIDINSPVGSTTTSVYTPQNGGFGEIGLSLTVICAPDFTGTVCQSRIDDCIGVNCNNGQCRDLVNNFECLCDPGYSGQFCNIDIDECEGVSCSGNGQCVDGVNSFTCNCVPGYTGELCEADIDECAGVNCSGNGQCVDGVNSFTCDCVPGYIGELCEADIDECVMMAMNCSGNGQCVVGINSFSCNCDPGYSGRFCQATEGQPSSDSTIIAAIVGGVLGSLLLILTVIIVLMAAVFISKRKMTHQPALNGGNDADVIEMKRNKVYGVVPPTGQTDIGMTRNMGVGKTPAQTAGADGYYVNEGMGPHDQDLNDYTYEYII